MDRCSFCPSLATTGSMIGIGRKLACERCQVIELAPDEGYGCPRCLKGLTENPGHRCAHCGELLERMTRRQLAVLLRPSAPSQPQGPSGTRRSP